MPFTFMLTKLSSGQGQYYKCVVIVLFSCSVSSVVFVCGVYGFDPSVTVVMV